MYKITLANGVVLDNLELNGNNYISSQIIENDVFENNLTTITINNGEIDTVYSNMRLMSNRVAADGRSWFVLGEKSEQEVREELLQQRIEELTGAILELSSMVL